MRAGFCWIALGSGIGGVARVFVGSIASGLLGNAFPYGTLAVNLLGCLVIGWIAAGVGRVENSPHSLRRRQFLMSGICGGFTTFSLFILATQQLLQQGNGLKAILYASATLFGGTLAAGVGFGFAQKRYEEQSGPGKAG